MNEFRIFRALGLSFRSWFRNFIPFTLLAAVMYAPVIYWMATYDVQSAHDLDGLVKGVFLYPLFAVAAISTLLSPMITYRVIQELNGQKASMLTSMKYGVRGILPAIILAVIVNVVQQIPFGAILGSIVTCFWFVAAPAAVAERLGPIAALSRSAQLTAGRRWGIFGLTFLLGLMVVVLLIAWIAPMIHASPEDIARNIKQTSIVIVCTLGVFQMLNGIVEAVSYALLRLDKDGISHDALAAVFE